MADAVQQVETDAEEHVMTEEEKQRAERLRQARARKIQGLELQKENILSQRVSSPVRRAALADALAQIEAELAKLQ